MKLPAEIGTDIGEFLKGVTYGHPGLVTAAIEYLKLNKGHFTYNFLVLLSAFTTNDVGAKSAWNFEKLTPSGK